jgi:hypothetical protein
MNDKTFIYNFLDKNFKVTVGVGKPIITDLYTNNILREIEFHTLVAKIIGTYITPDGTISRQIVSIWLNETLKNIGIGVHTYLHNCRVVLASDDWVIVNENDNEITFNFLVKVLDGVQSYNEISKYFDEWYRQKVTAAVDELMKTY